MQLDPRGDLVSGRQAGRRRFTRAQRVQLFVNQEVGRRACVATGEFSEVTADEHRETAGAREGEDIHLPAGRNVGAVEEDHSLQMLFDRLAASREDISEWGAREVFELRKELPASGGAQLFECDRAGARNGPLD